jgi:hypothetical protein
MCILSPIRDFNVSQMALIEASTCRLRTPTIIHFPLNVQRAYSTGVVIKCYTVNMFLNESGKQMVFSVQVFALLTAKNLLLLSRFEQR